MSIGGISSSQSGSGLTDALERLLQKARTQPTATPANPDGIIIVIGSAGTVLATGIQAGVLVIPEPYIIAACVLVADQSGSCVLDIKRAPYATTPVYTSIVASAPPTISAAVASRDTTLTGWSTTLMQYDILQYSVTSASTLNWVTVCLVGRRLLGG